MFVCFVHFIPSLIPITFQFMFDYINYIAHYIKQRVQEKCRVVEEPMYLCTFSLQYAIVEHFEGKVLQEIYGFASAKIHVCGFDFVLLF